MFGLQKVVKNEERVSHRNFDAENRMLTNFFVIFKPQI